MKPRKTFERLPEEKKERVLHAALQEFAEKGYSAASINRMVERAGIAKGSIFQYFGDKEGLFAAVFLHSLDAVKDTLRKVRDSSSEVEIFSRLARILEAGLAFTRNHPLIYRLYTHLLMEPDVPFRDLFLTRLREEGKTFLSELLQAAARRGEIRPDLPEAETLFLLEALMDRFLLASVLPYLGGGFLENTRPEERIHGFMDILKRGMASGEERA
ncbi:TetR/AcrR family transcriptional regulator [Desulfobotulus sp.]|uniref:TetR/AcrR family transcriptional regulator n=1 Tax=Desulfobotulus sp. TaxID=1940337 RepID=UPI002A360A98|nr:TetR/AcrR family transcriptional regulator [Desulfobotulus sp.]MDY0161714.1 TetR/AcrR family transcriptional regulator [Desulfobotulus sp.]